MSNPPPNTGAVSPQWIPPAPPYRPLAVAPNGQPLASFADRFVAYLIDSAIAFGFTLLYTIPFLIWWLNEFFSFVEETMPPPGVPADELPPPDSSGFFEIYVPMLWFTLASMVLGLLFTYLYWVELQKRWGGQTVGKRVMKIRVIPVNPAKTEVTRGSFMLRWTIGTVVGMVVYLFTLLDGLWQLWDKPLQQCLHDKAAETVVVKVG